MTNGADDPETTLPFGSNRESRELTTRMDMDSPTITANSRLALRLERDLAQEGRGSSVLVMAADYDRVSVETTTEVAWHLAEDLGRRVLLVDGSFNRSGLTEVLGGAQSPGMLDLLATETLSEEAIRTTMRPTAHVGIEFIPMGQDERRRLVPARADVLRQFLSITSRMADFVLIQGPVVAEARRTLAFGALVDAALLVTLEGELQIDELAHAQQVLGECGAERIGLVIGIPLTRSKQGLGSWAVGRASP